MGKRLLDSNIVIYSTQVEYQDLTTYLQEFKIFYSKITLVEVLGYTNLSKKDEELLHTFFNNTIALDIDDKIIQQAISLKQMKKMSLGDALIAGTSIIHQIPLLTRNVEDFKNIPDLQVSNPFDFIHSP